MPDATYLLASDLDGTLIPPVEVEDDGGIAELRSALKEHGGMLAYVTGRHLSLALDGIERHALPQPDILVCDVGTSVYFRRDDRYDPDPVYRARMLTALGAADPAALRRELDNVPGLTPQEAEKQAEFKLSYYAPVGAAGEEVTLSVEAHLGQLGGLVNVVYSVDTVAGTGLIDVLPAGVAKDTAVRYLHDRSGVPEERLVYAGDSGNDRAAMLSGFNVVVVGNADAGFREAIRAEAETLGIAARVYLAERPFAVGVLEGCRHFGIL